MFNLILEQRGSQVAHGALIQRDVVMMRRVRLLVSLLLAGSVGGCATAPRPSMQAVDQERALLDLRAKNAGYVRQIEELENRIFILEDQLDSRKLAAEQKAPPMLPARNLRADGREPVPSRGGAKTATTPTMDSYGGLAKPPAGGGTRAGTDDSAGVVETTIVAEHAVDYTGDAVETSAERAPALEKKDPASHARPMLRLTSASPMRERSARPATDAAAALAPEPLADSGAGALAQPDALRVYRQALETLRAGKPDAALPVFRRFLDAHPLHDYADNAQYWIGECYYAAGEFKAAERAFRAVVERYPRGNKVPDAMLKLGFTLQSMGDEAQGRAVLESLARAFPKHEAARLASERLAHPEPPPNHSGAVPTFGTVLPPSISATHGGGGVTAGATRGNR